MRYLLAVALFLMSVVGSAQDSSAQIFGQAFLEFEGEQQKQIVAEDIGGEQEKIVPNFCKMCGCCYEEKIEVKNIEWSDVGAAVNSRDLSIISLEQYDVAKNALAKKKEGKEIYLEVEKYKEATANFCRLCGCCEQSEFSIERAKALGMTSIFINGRLEDSDGKWSAIMVPRELIGRDMEKLLEP